MKRRLRTGNSHFQAGLLLALLLALTVFCGGKARADTVPRLSEERFSEESARITGTYSFAPAPGKRLHGISAENPVRRARAVRAETAEEPELKQVPALFMRRMFFSAATGEAADPIQRMVRRPQPGGRHAVFPAPGRSGDSVRAREHRRRSDRADPQFRRPYFFTNMTSEMHTSFLNLLP